MGAIKGSFGRELYQISCVLFPMKPYVLGCPQVIDFHGPEIAFATKQICSK